MMTAIDVHHHYVPRQLIEETIRHGKALGVDVSEVQGSYALILCRQQAAPTAAGFDGRR